MYLEGTEYERIIRVFPRVCVDLLVADSEGRVLLLKRTNEPAIGQWWFPGGRVHIGETRLQAAQRKLRQECSLHIDAEALQERGSFDLFFEIEGDRVHDVTILFRVQVPNATDIVTDAEASAYGWFMPGDCRGLGLHPYVHGNILTHA